MDIHTRIDQAEQGVINSLNAIRQLLHDQNRVLQFGTWAVDFHRILTRGFHLKLTRCLCA